MTAPVKPSPDRDPVKVLIGAKLVSSLASRPLKNLTNDELEDLTSAGETVLFAAFLETEDREAARKAAQLTPRSAGNLRLAAVHGELTPAGQRSLRARRAAKARWAR